MTQYSIVITAQFDNCKSDMLLYSETKSICTFNDESTFWDWLHKYYPLLPWTKDDGKDFDEAADPDYCQYVSYPDTDQPDSCILASFNVTEK